MPCRSQVLRSELAAADAALEGAQRQARRAAEERDVISGQLQHGVEAASDRGDRRWRAQTETPMTRQKV